jgi:hypothetical protein
VTGATVAGCAAGGAVGVAGLGVGAGGVATVLGAPQATERARRSERARDDFMSGSGRRFVER